MRPKIGSFQKTSWTFQSTHSRGVRQLSDAFNLSVVRFQSTHSRGVRLEIVNSYIQSSSNFNPRTHEECDHEKSVVKVSDHLFQSTHSRGVRLSEAFQQDESLSISIHALTRSATNTEPMVCIINYISIHALTRSAT